jgi:biotin operon repressor
VTLAGRIVSKLRVEGTPLDDDDLAARLGVVRQAVNQACRRLAASGVLVREVGRDGKLINRLTSTSSPQPLPDRPAPQVRDHPAFQDVTSPYLPQDEVKAAVKGHLEAKGYTVTVAWGRALGADLDAKGPAGRIIIKAKGAVALQPQPANYFIGALGELVQRMGDPDARYALALPDNKQYRNLVAGLPALAWERLRLRVYFVGKTHAGFVVDELTR